MKTTTINRIQYIFMNGIASMLSPFTSLLFAYLVVRFSTKEIWGDFVDLLLFFFIATLLYNWGINTYLTRSFSEQPNRMKQNWQSFFISRSPFLFLTMAIALFFLPQHFIFWLIAGYLTNSIQPILSYKRNYTLIIFTELITFSILCLIIVLYPITSELLIIAYGIYLGIKGIIYCASQFDFFKEGNWSFNSRLLLITLPFLFMNVAGFLQSKVDLYVFAFFSNNAALGEYQIISGFLILAQSIPTILIIPFLKNIYRMKDDGVRKMRKTLAIGGIFINLILILSIAFILKTYFEITLNWTALAAGFLISYPPYIYAIRVFELFKMKQEKTVLQIILISMGINFIVALILLSCSFGLIGGLIANAFSQLCCLTLYLIRTKNDRIPQLSE